MSPSRYADPCRRRTEGFCARSPLRRIPLSHCWKNGVRPGRTVQLLLDMADFSEISRELELALFYDRQLNLKKRSLSLDEFQTAHARIYKGMDANKDGRLTMEEMRAFLQGASRSLRPGSPRE